METQTLAGKTIAVPETRELDLFAALLERRGAQVLRCPLVVIRDAADPAPVLNFIRRFAEGACDDPITCITCATNRHRSPRLKFPAAQASTLSRLRAVFANRR